MPAPTKPFWRIFAIAFLAHFGTLESVFFYAVSWSITTSSSMPFHIRSGAADVVFAVLAFPLSLVLAAFPSFNVPGNFGLGVLALFRLSHTRLPLVRQCAQNNSS